MSAASVDREPPLEHGDERLVSVHDDRDRVEPVGLAVDGLDAVDELVHGLLDGLLDDAEHDAEADGRERDVLVARFRGRLQSAVDDLAERTDEVVDDEHDVLERAAVRAVALGDDGLPVLERHGGRSLTVERPPPMRD